MLEYKYIKKGCIFRVIYTYIFLLLYFILFEINNYKFFVMNVGVF